MMESRGDNKYKTEDLIIEIPTIGNTGTKEKRVNPDFWHFEIYPEIRTLLDMATFSFDSKWIEKLEKTYYYEPGYINETFRNRINELTDKINSDESQEFIRIWNTKDLGQLDELGLRLNKYMANERPDLLKAFNEKGRRCLPQLYHDPLIKRIAQIQKDIKERDYLREKISNESPVILAKPESDHKEKTESPPITLLQREQAILSGENKFNQLPMEDVLTFFKVLAQTMNSQGKPFLSMDQIYTFIEAAFLEKHTEIVTFNLGPQKTGDRTAVRCYFHALYDYCSRKKSRDKRASKSKYVYLLCANSDNYDFETVSNNFSKSKKEEKAITLIFPLK